MTNQSVSIADLNDIKQLQIDLNERLFKLCKKAVLFADNPFMEWFTLTCGIGTLIKEGDVQNIKQFNSFQVLIIACFIFFSFLGKIFK